LTAVVLAPGGTSGRAVLASGSAGSALCCCRAVLPLSCTAVGWAASPRPTWALAVLPVAAAQPGGCW